MQYFQLCSICSLSLQASGHKDVIVHLAHMLDSMSVANAKGSILWLIGEYCDKVPKIAPDVLRKAAKAFTQEVILREQIISFVGLWDRLVARARGSKSKGLSSSLSHTEAE